MAQDKNKNKKKNAVADNNGGQDNTQEKINEKDIEAKEDQKLEEYGQMTLEENRRHRKIHLITIIGEVEGHENLSGNSKATKYDHVLPQLAQIEDDDTVDGLLVLLNTSGGDVDAGLAIAEMIASLSMPTVSLVLGGSHSIGVPLAVSTNYSFIVPSGTMMIHPVRMSGMVIGSSQTYDRGPDSEFRGEPRPHRLRPAEGTHAQYRDAHPRSGHCSGGKRGCGSRADRRGWGHQGSASQTLSDDRREKLNALALHFPGFFCILYTNWAYARRRV